MSLHDYVFDRCEDLHRSGARVVRPETADLAGSLVEIDAILLLGRNEELLFRYDRDPVNRPEMPDHEHVPPDRRIESGAVTFRDVLDETYAVVAEPEAEDADR